MKGESKKCTCLYSGAEPQFVEGEVFRTVIPLASVATVKAGPNTQVRTQDNTQVKIQDEILAFCEIARSKQEIIGYYGMKSTKSFTSHYLKPLLDSGKLKMTLPDKPNSKNQEYIKVYPL